MSFSDIVGVLENTLRFRRPNKLSFCFADACQSPCFSGALLLPGFDNALLKRCFCALVGGLVGGLAVAAMGRFDLERGTIGSETSVESVHMLGDLSEL